MPAQTWLWNDLSHRYAYYRNIPEAFTKRNGREPTKKQEGTCFCMEVFYLDAKPDLLARDLRRETGGAVVLKVTEPDRYQGKGKTA